MNEPTGVKVVRGLFDQDTHEQIVSFVEHRSRLLPLVRDESLFIRHSANDVPFFTAIHRQLVEFASDLFGEQVKPSYSFLALYGDGGTCPVHVDRPQCRYTIDYLIRQTQLDPWPICIAEPFDDDKRNEIERTHGMFPDDEDQRNRLFRDESWQEVDLCPNDAVCYSGTHSWHYRPNKLNGTADLVFFHFVPVAFDGPLA